jgi:hypothetical protein
MSLSSSIVSVQAGQVVLVAQDKAEATAEQWAQLMEHVREGVVRENGDMQRITGMVISDGGAPTVEQRANLKVFLAGKKFRIVVATDVAVVRVVVGLMSWFNPEMKVVAPTRVDQWFEFAHVQTQEHAEVWQVMWKLQQSIGGLTTAKKMNPFFSRAQASA